MYNQQGGQASSCLSFEPVDWEGGSCVVYVCGTYPSTFVGGRARKLFWKGGKASA